MKVVFFGTPLFSAKVLQYLLEHNVNIVAVITKPDKPQGRSSALVPTPVKCIAQQHNIPCYQPELVSDLAFAATLEQYQADLFVVVAYGEIIKQHLLDMPKATCINLHTSLLPKFRGAAPIQRSIIEGETETGVTIIHMAKKMDAGDIIANVSVAIGPDMTYGELEQILCQEGSELLLKTTENLSKGECPRTSQNETEITFAPKIELEHCQINWNHSAQSIHNLVRGVTPHPGAWCMVTVKDQPKRLRVITTRLSTKNPADSKPGQILSCNKEGLTVKCGKNSLTLVQVQLEGKKAMSADEFARGLPPDALKFVISG